MGLRRWIRRKLVLRQIAKGLRAAGLPEDTVSGIMSGWKTWVGGLSLIVSGLAMILATIKAGEYDIGEIQKGLALIGSGFATIGLGHKIEKAAGGGS